MAVLGLVAAMQLTGGQDIRGSAVEQKSGLYRPHRGPHQRMAAARRRARLSIEERTALGSGGSNESTVAVPTQPARPTADATAATQPTASREQPRPNHAAVAQPAAVAPPPPSVSGAASTGRACADGCHVHGNCNRELGRCDCPPLRAGKACEQSVAPLCAVQWGMRLPFPPCQVWTPNLMEYLDFPVTCECLAECQSLNVRVEYAKACVNTTASGQRLEPESNKSKGIPYPWHDRFSDGKWMQQPYDDRVRLRGDEAVALEHANLAARLHTDGAASAKERACSGHGLLTKHVPMLGADHGKKGKFCHCFPGWFGELCEHGPGHPRAPPTKQQCVHGCSGRGVCKLNWCHCVPGTWGIDCSEGEAAAADTAAAVAAATGTQRAAALAAVPSADLERSFGLDLAAASDALHAPGGWGWPAAMATAPPPRVSSTEATRHAVRFYVYDLPPKYNAWLAAHFKFSSSGRWDDSWLYSLDIALHRWLLRSPYRTRDPAKADFFFVPLYTSLGFYDFEFGLYWLSGRGFTWVREAFDYVKQTWPYWNKTQGARHLLVMTNDKGATFARGAVRALDKATIVSQWGWKRPHIHKPELDVIVPPMLKVSSLLDASPFLRADASPASLADAAEASAASPEQLLLSFIGSIRPKNRGYSFGVRQQVFKLFNQTEGFFLRDLRGESIHGVHRRMEHSEFLAVLHRSKFCLAPAGMGFSTRVYESIAQGCVPLIIQHEDVSDTEADQAFEDLLPYANFSLRLRKEHIPQLPQILRDFPRERWLQFRRNLGCVWPRIMWLRAQKPQLIGGGGGGGGGSNGGGGGGGESAQLERYDAFETLMASLTRKAAVMRNEARCTGTGARRRCSGEPEAVPDVQWWVPAHSCHLS